MRLSWNEIRVRAADFARAWADAGYEKGETQIFYSAFFKVFGVQSRTVVRYEEHVRKLDDSHGYIDLFWPGVLLVEQKSAGGDLAAAEAQADSYFDALPEWQRPRYRLVSDFQTFRLCDLDEREETEFQLSELPDHVEKFGFIIGVAPREFRDQDPVNVKASELMGKLHDELKASGYDGHDLEVFLVRTVFCLFAENTGIFERDLFLQLLEDRTAPDGSDTGMWLARLAQVLNRPEDQRQANLDEDLARFPYVNGDLFKEDIRIADFNSGMRETLIEACQFDWSKVSPAIFGALFQSVMLPEERRAQGAHYTTEQNILKVIEPLFLDGLRAEFKKLKDRRDTHRRMELQRFQQRLGELRLFDPACGCGNFLIIAYRELRELEIEVLREIRAARGRGPQRELGTVQSVIDVDQFYGIELDEFPTRIAETALWMMDHIMNNRLSLEFGESFLRIPLKKSPHIRKKDALDMEWSELLPADQCSYVFGNPPFVGAKLQSPEQRAQVRRIAALGGSGGTLDYVTAWFIKAGEYIGQCPDTGNKPRIGFVATNSITQGEQVGQLWPILFDRLELEIAFAHRTFAWGSDARGRAHVDVVVIGLTGRGNAPRDRQLFSYDDIKGEPHEGIHGTLSPYLFDAGQLTDPHLVAHEKNTPEGSMPQLIIGSKPIDGKNYILKSDERQELLQECPEAAPYIRPYVGSREFIQGGERYILWLGGAAPAVLRHPELKRRIEAVREFRNASTAASTRELANTPTRYHVNVIPKTSFLVIPKTSSERREYVPIGWLEPPTIPSDALFVLGKATRPLFALLTSAMHMTWLRHIGGRLASRYRYSIGLVYNTFPLPAKLDEKLASLEPFADAVLTARAEHPEESLANLYDPNSMPPDLYRAHRSLDRAVDRLYRRKAFNSERERIEYLFAEYERNQQQQVPISSPATARRRKQQSRSRRKTMSYRSGRGRRPG